MKGAIYTPQNIVSSYPFIGVNRLGSSLLGYLNKLAHFSIRLWEVLKQPRILVFVLLYFHFYFGLLIFYLYSDYLIPTPIPLEYPLSCNFQIYPQKSTWNSSNT